MGQLTASIAHEVNQPIAAAITNAQATLRWQSAARPDLDEARQALRRIVENGNRAGEVIGRIRAPSTKAPPRKDDVAINDAILEVVALTHKADPDGVLVAVRDSGPGLAPETLERLFDAFYTTKASGMGMGLSICRSIIEAHGGRLWASANLPRGAVFQFTVPADPEPS
jgi:signal transduction histidine kinase